MLLILTSEKDFAADFLIVELLKRQLPYFRMNAEDLGERADYLFALDRDEFVREITVGPKTLKLSDVTAVWYRRALHPLASGQFTPAVRKFVSGELRHLATGIALNPEVVWVNPIDRVTIAEHKLYQLQVAQREGLRVPRTLVSRDISKLRSFAAGNSSGTICKPIFHGLFSDGAFRYSVYTRRVSPDTLDAESVSACPVFLQEEISRRSDVRATFIGPQSFVADIRGDEQLVDWREPKNDVGYSISSLSEDVERRCRAMMTRLGLLYGAFDFIRTPEGELVFLEVNPTGEWAWLEDRLGFPMRNAFVEILYGEQK